MFCSSTGIVYQVCAACQEKSEKNPLFLGEALNVL